MPKIGVGDDELGLERRWKGVAAPVKYDILASSAGQALSEAEGSEPIYPEARPSCSTLICNSFTTAIPEPTCTSLYATRQFH